MKKQLFIQNGSYILFMIFLILLLFMYSAKFLRTLRNHLLISPIPPMKLQLAEKR